VNPVFDKFFRDNVQHKAVVRDRQALQSVFSSADANGRLSIDALKTLPPRSANDPLSTEILNLDLRQAELRSLQQRFTDAHSLVIAKKEEIRVLETQTVPLLARQTLQQLEIAENELRTNIEGQASELRRIPERTIEEARQEREVMIASSIYEVLQQRYSSAVLQKQARYLTSPYSTPRACQVGRRPTRRRVSFSSRSWPAWASAWGRRSCSTRPIVASGIPSRRRAISGSTS
jgi:hypothetical protein